MKMMGVMVHETPQMSLQLRPRHPRRTMRFFGRRCADTLVSVRPRLVLEDPGGEPLVRLLGNPMHIGRSTPRCYRHRGTSGNSVGVMNASALLLSQLQFVWVIGWHILLPAFTVGMASFIALLEIRWAVTGGEIYRNISTFWIRIFAVAFGMGVVTGIVTHDRLHSRERMDAAHE
jgi:hypothetical protein